VQQGGEEVHLESRDPHLLPPVPYRASTTLQAVSKKKARAAVREQCTRRHAHGGRLQDATSCCSSWCCASLLLSPCALPYSLPPAPCAASAQAQRTLSQAYMNMLKHATTCLSTSTNEQGMAQAQTNLSWPTCAQSRASFFRLAACAEGASKPRAEAQRNIGKLRAGCLGQRQTLLLCLPSKPRTLSGSRVMTTRGRVPRRPGLSRWSDRMYSIDVLCAT
jgi:hypothetical protein